MKCSFVSVHNGHERNFVDLRRGKTGQAISEQLEIRDIPFPWRTLQLVFLVEPRSIHDPGPRGISIYYLAEPGSFGDVENCHGSLEPQRRRMVIRADFAFRRPFDKLLPASPYPS